jgi:hypothetical protein
MLLLGLSEEEVNPLVSELGEDLLTDLFGESAGAKDSGKGHGKDSHGKKH